ncbi:hypothetical protein OPU71_02610 [Niveibacterium sp. 24ML]|uniref:hypothetical protein n=1 Tax=Niveibacterium sp. 24ML TaxID=2985512 RepID=UPI00227101AB|nr:hypothetical protein [Niveibacterium sp. 24ML]MCX9155013.1 hypothetical protein [Niveibacterium sp. 24ML]
MLARGFKFAAAGLALTAVSWLAMVIWWQSRPQVIDAGDVLLGLVALPAAVCALALLGWFVWRRVTAPPAPVAAASPAAPAQAAAAVAVPEALVLSIGVATAAGADPDAVIEAIAAGDTQPEPDADFIDTEGLPVRLKRIDDLEFDELDAWLADDAARVPNAFRRALAMLPQAMDPVLRDLVDAMPPPASVHAAPRALPITVRALIPEGWDESMLAYAKRWIEHRIALAWAETPPPVKLTSAREDASAHTELAAWLNDATQVRALMLLSVHSAVDEAAIEQLDLDGRLFRHDRAEGVVPGEAAACVLFARAGMTLGMDVLARLALPLRAQRDAAPRAAGRVDAGVLEGLIERSFHASQCAAEQVACLVCDGDVRPSRGIEVASAMNSQLPQLDPVSDRIGIGAALGDLGAAGATLALALAASQVRALQKPVALAAIADPTQRSLALLQPYLSEPATA